jgi:hypothetical protein
MQPGDARNWNCAGEKGYTLTTTMIAHGWATPESKVRSESSAALN